MGAFQRKYATATHVYLPIVKRGVVDLAVSADWTPASGDVKVSIDGGATASIATLPVAIAMGNTAMWDFALSSGETTGKKISITVADAATKAVEDQMFVVETYGNASAEYQADMSAANLPADAKAINAVSTSNVTTVNANLGTTQPTNFTGTGASALVKGDAVDIGSQAASLDANNLLKVALVDVIGTALTESGSGRLAAAIKKFFDVATPTGTVNSLPDAVPNANGGLPILSVSGTTLGYTVSTLTTYTGNTLQTGDAYAIVNNGTYGNAALLAAVQNVQNNTFIATSIPYTLERPDSGSVTVNISLVFSDETGAAKNLDSGNPTITLVNDAGTDLSSRLGSFTNPATGKYVVPYTSSASDALEGLHWDVAGTINSKLRRMVAYTQVVDTTAVDFTSTDRTNLGTILTQTTAAATRGAVGLGAANLDTQFAGLPAATRDVSNSSPAAGSLGEAARNADAKAAVLIDTIGAPAGASVSADIAAVKSDTGTLLTNLIATMNRLGAFTGSGVNTVLGFFRALMSKSATLPSDVGGTFDPADDSTEAIRDRGDAAWLTATVVSINGIDAATANKIADHGRRRTQANVELSSDGDTLNVASLYGAIQQMQVSNLVDNAGKLTVYKTDAVTVLAQLDVSSASGADEITGVG